MKILILGLNYAPERIGIAVYTTGMAEALAAAGHEVRVVAGQPYYPAWKIMPGHHALAFSRETRNGVDVLRVPHYIPAIPTGKRRLLHHASFAMTALLPMLWNGLVWRPDVVLAIAPSLVAAPAAALAAALGGAQSWLHIQDFEVEAAFATKLLSAGNWLGRLARNFERTMLNAFSRVSSISPEMCRKLIAKGVPAERVVEFRNWTDVDRIAPLKGPSPYRAEWGVTTKHVALYSGNIANKQGVEIIVDAARRLADRQDLSFVICGEGPNRAALEARAAGLDNIQFRDLQPAETLNDLVGLATIHLLPQVAGAADLVLPSKLTNMLASGRPVVATAARGTGLAREVEGCGLRVPPGDTEGLTDAIATLVDDDALHAKLSTAARRRAEDHWSGTTILARFETELHDLCAQPHPGEPIKTPGE